jgi:hypothetical protein
MPPEFRCETDLDALQGMRLSSLRNFNATFLRRQAIFQSQCLGPAKMGLDSKVGLEQSGYVNNLSLQVWLDNAKSDSYTVV